MQILYAVIDDVYEHTVGAVLRYTIGSSVHTETTVVHPLHSTFLDETIVDTIPETGDESSEPQTFRALGTLIEARAPSTNLSRSVAYVGSARTPLFASPTKEFDTVVTTLSYGAMVMVLEEKGRFSKVAQDGLIGWVLRDDLADRAAHTYPEFVIGEENHAEDPNTLRLRASITDEFSGGETEVTLQAGEYVLYKIIRKGQSINWPPTRPRTPGRWHIFLRGTPGIHIGIMPKTGSIMEYMLQNDIGHLAYVEAVFPDERITLSEVNNPDHGIYNERTLTKEEWQALNPVFIQVS